MHIAHLTLNTGHVRTIRPGEVTGETLSWLTPWLDVLVRQGEAAVPGFDGYTTRSANEGDALIVSVFGPPIDGVPVPLVSVGIARTEAEADALWPLMMGQGGAPMPPPAPGVRRPAAPWCAAATWPGVRFDPGAVGWLGDFERCLAWAWCSEAGRALRRER